MIRKASKKGNDSLRAAREIVQKSASEIEWRNKKKLETESEDTKIRREINLFIIAKVIEGRSREDILKRVNFVFSSAKYELYRKFFEVWVDGALKTRGTQTQNEEIEIDEKAENESKEESER